MIFFFILITYQVDILLKLSGKIEKWLLHIGQLLNTLLLNTGLTVLTSPGAKTKVCINLLMGWPWLDSSPDTCHRSNNKYSISALQEIGFTDIHVQIVHAWEHHLSQKRFHSMKSFTFPFHDYKRLIDICSFCDFKHFSTTLLHVTCNLHLNVLKN